MIAVIAVIAVIVRPPKARAARRRPQRRRRPEGRATRNATTDSNRLTLAATLATRGDLRHTPAGIPAIDCTLIHRSTQAEAGGERKVECELHAVAFGEAARRLSRVAAGSEVQCEGFVARRYRTGAAVAFHITEFELHR